MIAVVNLGMQQTCDRDGNENTSRIWTVSYFNTHSKPKMKKNNTMRHHTYINMKS